ncbi:hypothetical protein PVAND_003647 [Polypedilum vanderplanki]|uniref:Glucuronosyltransferase n=1 Tax=Polypedilum vanderplanki TaxID=319348 RepID=A0A9J6BV77_POLVA|nr:hypothetical protein PVAND_003647 [Polypedilum vanderplanki]
MRSFCLLISLFSIFTISSHGLNILAILPLSMKSHYAIGNSIVKNLLNAGHNVTSITMFEPEQPINNYRVIHIPDTMNVSGWGDMNPLDYNDIPILLSVVMMPMMGADMINEIMKSEELNEFLERQDENFDVCILEIFTSEALLGIVEKYNCVLIQYTTFDAFIWIDKMTGNESPPSYVPHPFLEYTDNMSFVQRFYNKFFVLIDDFFYNFLHIPWQKFLYRKYFPNAKRTFDEMYRNSSIIFINNHVSHSFPRPHHQTQIEIGGIHVKPAKTFAKRFSRFSRFSNGWCNSIFNGFLYRWH